MAQSAHDTSLMSAPPALALDGRAAVLAWFDAARRALPFRGTRDPYGILVSEVMAQQTQISRVGAAWTRFMERFPTVRDLADASPADVLREWQGMGYDRRALNLLRAARMIVAEHEGVVPRDVAALERLPGVGPYTARAVASIAFGQAVGAVDTNVRRVLGRALGGVARRTRSAAWIQAAADLAVDPRRPGDWTAALMDVGAMVCHPVSPLCEACPLQAWCAFARERLDRPVEESARLPVASRPAPARPVGFAATTRWLRGRIVDRLRAADGTAWVTIVGPIGSHDAPAVRDALRALARDGLIELTGDDPLRARLATA
ncbi:MAG TPA: A/G-specific adenine glycosylase [Patescibacteria group bacterium]|nr:A/G-specific adenine glycosylase [Patescibacteria group bacterium]